METTTFSFDGTLIAETPLSVGRPGDDFTTAEDGKKQIGRLPRRGPRMKNTPVFFPASTINGGIRRAATDFIRRAITKATKDQNPFTLDEFYMMVQGVDTAQLLSEENKKFGLVQEEFSLRQANPFLSLFGRWGLPGHLAIGDAIPLDDQGPVMYITGNGARVAEFSRSPEQVNFLSPVDKERLVDMLREDTKTQKEIAAMKDEVRKLKKGIRELDGDEKSKVQKSIANIDANVKKKKDGKVGSSETIQRTLDGYECIAPGTRMSHKMVLTNASQLELGLFLHSLAEFSRDPRLGAHLRQGAGEISGRWDVSIRPVDSWRSVTVGKVSFSAREFAIEDLTDDMYFSNAAKALSDAMVSMTDSGIDFKRYAKLALPG